MIKDAIAKIPRRERQEPFRRCRSRPKFQVDHSRHLEASACFRCTVLLFALRRGQEETGSVPVRLHNHDTGGRKCAEGREVPHWLCQLDGHIASPHTKPRWLSHQLLVAFPLQNPSEYFSLVHSGMTEPSIEKLLAPRRYGYCS